MRTLKIASNAQLHDIESLYEDLAVYTKANEKIDLYLPKKLTKNYLGLVPSIYQFVITWVRYENSAKLRLDIELPDSSLLTELYESELFFPIIVLVWNNNGVYNKTGEINLRNHLIEYNSKIHFQMKAAKPFKKGWKLLLTNFDHLPSNKGILNSFEIENKFVLNENSLYDSLNPGILEILGYSKDITEKYNAVAHDFIGVIYELMKNTFEWGREDEFGVPLDPNARGLLVKFYKKRRKSFLNEFGTHNGLLDYFKNEVLKENGQHELYLLEISVFDGGVGFVNKYKETKEVSELSNVDIVKECLIKHMTSSITLEKDDKGRGLDRILNILDGKGFLRIKTGDVTVYRNLITHPYQNIGKTKNMTLFDWGNCSSTEYTRFPNSQGSVITIIFPLAF